MKGAVRIDHDTFVRVHKAGPQLERRRGQVSGVADNRQRPGGVGLNGGGRRAVNEMGLAIDLHQRQQRRVRPDFDRLEGLRRLQRIDHGHVRLVARRSG